MAKWSTAYKDSLSDSSFLIVLPGGTKENGVTIPKHLRKFPVYDSNGQIDINHLHSALTKISTASIPPKYKRIAQRKAEKLLNHYHQSHDLEKAMEWYINHAMSRELPLAKASNGQRWVTIKEGHLRGRHILIDSKGYIVGGAVPRAFHGHHIAKLKGIGNEENPYHQYEHHQLKEIYHSFRDANEAEKRELNELIHNTAKYLMEMHQLKHKGNSDILKRVRQFGGVRPPVRGKHSFAEEYHESVPVGVRRAIGNKEGRPLDEMADELGMNARELIDRLANAETQGYLSPKDFYHDAEETIDQMQGEGEVANRRQSIADMENELDKIQAAIRHKVNQMHDKKSSKRGSKLAASIIALGGRLLVKKKNDDETIDVISEIDNPDESIADRAEESIRYHVTSAADKILREGFKPNKGVGVGGEGDRTAEVYTSEDPAYSFRLRDHFNSLEEIRTSEDPLSAARAYVGEDGFEAAQGDIGMYENILMRDLSPAEKAMIVAVPKNGEFPELEPESFFRNDPRRTFKVIGVDVSNGHKRGESTNFGHEESWIMNTVNPFKLQKSEDDADYYPSDRNAYKTNVKDVIYIPINRIDTPYQTDKATDPYKVKINVGKMRRGEALDPIVIGYGSDDGRRADLHDGHHRLEASKKMGYTHVPCVVGGRNERRVKAAEKRYRQMWKSENDDMNLAKSDDTLPVGTEVTWHYRSAIGHGTIEGIAKKGKTHADTKYRIREHDHHPGEPAIVEHYGRALHRVGSIKKSLSIFATRAGRLLVKTNRSYDVTGELKLVKKLSGHLKQMVNEGNAHWVTIKDGPLEGRHLLIEGARPAKGAKSTGRILAGHGIPRHVIEKITGATHADHLNHEQAEHDSETGNPIGNHPYRKGDTVTYQRPGSKKKLTGTVEDVSGNTLKVHVKGASVTVPAGHVVEHKPNGNQNVSKPKTDDKQHQFKHEIGKQIFYRGDMANREGTFEITNRKHDEFGTRYDMHEIGGEGRSMRGVTEHMISDHDSGNGSTRFIPKDIHDAFVDKQRNDLMQRMKQARAEREKREAEEKKKQNLKEGSHVDLGGGLTGEIRHNEKLHSFTINEHRTGRFLGLGSTPEDAVENTNKKLDREGRENMLAEIESELKGPFTHKEVERFNNTTQFPTTVKRLNDMYHDAVNSDHENAKKQLERYGMHDIPAEVQEALDKLAQAREHKMREDFRAREIAPPWTVTGRSNYKGRPDRARSVEQNAQEVVDKAKKRLAIAIKQSSPDRVISSDESDAVQQLEAKIAQAEKHHENMKRANKIIKQKDLSEVDKVKKIMELGFSMEDAAEAVKPRFGWTPGFGLTNSNANIKRMKERVEQLKQRRSELTSTHSFDGGVIHDNVDDNRLQIFFDDKPDAEMRQKLKSRGFRWSPSAVGPNGEEGAWQRFRSPEATRIARDITGAKVEKHAVLAVDGRLLVKKG